MDCCNGSFARSFCRVAVATTWFGLSMKTALLLLSWCPLLLPLCYWLMDKKHNRVESPGTGYLPLGQSPQQQPARLTPRRKMLLIWYNMPLGLSMHAGVFARYFLQQAVLTTLVLPGFAVKARDHYQYYLLTLTFGDLLGKSYGVVALLLNYKLPQCTKQTWAFSSLSVSVTIFLVLAAWFRFLHSEWVVIIISFWVGVLSGAVYDTTFAVAYGEPNSLSKKFSKAVLSLPYAAAHVSASLLGAYIEPLLEEHCMYLTGMLTRCIARSMHD